MKKIMLFAFLIAALNSCKKSTDSASPSGIPLPWNCNTLHLPTTGISPDGVSIGDVSGVLAACYLIGTIKDTSGRLNPLYKTWQCALLSDSTSSASVNSVNMTADPHYVAPVKASYISYVDTAWHLAGSNTWTVNEIGTSSFTAEVAGTIPQFRDTMPSTIDQHADFEYHFINTVNTVNADYAYIVIYKGGSYVTSPVVSAHNGIAKIPAAYLATSPSGYGEPVTVVDGKTYRGRLIAVVLYSYTVQTIGGKKYAFAKQTVYVSFATFK